MRTLSRKRTGCKAISPAAPFRFPAARRAQRSASSRNISRSASAISCPRVSTTSYSCSAFFLLTTKLRPLLVQVTCFTVAHSVTLGLAMYGIVSVSPRIVEPLIALSIAYVAIENIATPKLTPWRPIIVFCFGLLHGLGFAGALQELHLARSEFLPALVSFNVGIELAQLAVIAAAYFAVAFWSSDKVWYRSRIVVPASAAIAAAGLFWTVQRIVA
jgi:hypothetical protein